MLTFEWNLKKMDQSPQDNNSCKLPVILGVCGAANAGKTTLIERLIPAFKKMGYRVGTIKHAACEFEIDRKGKDSWRHAMAGADVVAIDARGRVAVFMNPGMSNTIEGSLKRLLPFFSGVELVLAEGYKSAGIKKIEVHRNEISEPLCTDDPNLVALVSDSEPRIDVPVFTPDQVEQIARFLAEKFLREY